MQYRPCIEFDLCARLLTTESNLIAGLDVPGPFPHIDQTVTSSGGIAEIKIEFSCSVLIGTFSQKEIYAMRRRSISSRTSTVHSQ
jgi:hypothetical protein